MVSCKCRAEHTCVYGLPLRCAPCRIVNAVGDIAYKEFLREITLVHVLEDFLRHLSVKHGHAVNILGDVGGKVTHGELLMGIQRIVLTKGHEGFPVHFKALRIMADILPQETFLKGIVAGGNRSVGGEQGACANNLKGL